MSLSDSAAVTMIIVAFFGFLTIWAVVVNLAPDNDIIFDAEIIAVSDSKYKVQHPNGDYLWAGQNRHNLDVGDFVIVKITGDSTYVIDEVK